MSSSASGGNTAAFGIASSTSPGMVSTGAQTFGGSKTFQDGTVGPGSVPIGCMIVAMPNIDAVNSWQPPSSGAIKDGFMRADGTIINAGHVSQGCLLAAGTVLPNMIQKYPRGNTTSGTTGGSNTFTPAGTNATSNVAASGLAFSGTGINPSSTFAAAGNFTDSVSVPASGLTFSGTSATYSVSVPGHYHGMGTGASLSVDINHTHGSQTFTSGNQSADHTHTGGTGYAGNARANNGILVGQDNQNSQAWDDYTLSRGTYVVSPTGGTGNFPGRLHTHSFTTDGMNVSHTHSTTVALSALGATPKTPTGSIGLVTGGVDGNAVHTASGSNTPSGTIAGTATGTGTATARSSWFTSTTYTPSGTITGTATAAAQAFTGTPASSEPAYVEVIWVIRVK